MGTRRERVIVSLDDDFSSPMARCAGATALLNHELNRLSGQAVVSSRFARTVERDMDGVSKSTRRAGADINQFSGRLSVLLRLLALVGPTAAPIGAVAIAGISGLAAQFGFAATGALSLVVASQGVGEALKAVNEAALEPTAENLEKARAAMADLGPEAQEFVKRFQEIRPVLKDIRDSAAAGWFPGLTEALDSFETAGPRLGAILEAIGESGGNLLAEGADALAGPEWSEFLLFVEMNAPQALDELGRSVGNIIKGLAEMWMAFDPLNDDFSSWLLDASRGFADWAEGLSATEGFAEFVEYVRTNGPKVAEAAGAIANAILQIVEAAAPIAGPVLEALTRLADVIAVVADSPLGTPIMAGVAAMSALTLATNVATASLARFKVAQAAAGFGSGGKASAGAKGGGLVGLAGGGPAGLATLAGIVGFSNAIDNLEKGIGGERSGGKGLLRALVPAISTLEMFGVEIPGLTDKTNDLTDANKDAADSYLDLGASTSAAKDRLSEYNRVSLGAFSATTQYREALKAAREQADQNSAGIKGNSDAALANRAALERLAGAWQTQRAEMAAAGASTDEVAGRQRGARRAFMEVAESMGVSRRRARQLADALLGIPPKVSSSVNVDGLGTALQGVRTLKNELAGLGNPKVSAPQPQGTKALFGGENPADGGTIPRFGGRPIRSAAGSTVPDDGGGYRDYLLYMLAPLEEVISNRRGQADRFRPELKDINAGMSRAEVIERMLMRGLVTTPRTAAGGGTAGKQIVSSLAGPGGPRKGDSVLGFFPEVGKSAKELRAWVKSLEESRSTIENELKERQSLADALGESIKNRLTTNPFGDTDPWSAGSTFEDVMAVLAGDTTAARAQTEDIETLKAKGLDGDALTALLADADNETIAAWADLSADQLDQYERAFQDRALAVADAQTAAMNAAFGAQLAPVQAELANVNAQLAEANRLLAIAPDATGKKAGQATAKANNKGAGKASLNMRRG
ncbi:hypothetical protein [Nocardioides sp. BYT-33-1]|uniref:hypothetical protein n=1 Tax=Nocardioides sp. BYT-33-1 TaxID=3416952 RepID=UPI003F530DE4